MLRCRCYCFLSALLVGQAYPALAAEGDPLDWPYWRGPEMNGISREKNLPSKWSPEGENLVWKSEQLGTRSTPIVLRNKLYTLCRHNPQTPQEAEKVVCADANTGKILWENVFNVFLSDVPDTRVGWSSVVGDPETGNVFALGVCDFFQCIDGSTGKTLWSHSLSEEFGMLNTYGGRTNFPIVFENLAIISGVITGWGEMSKPAFRILAFDKRNGQCVWFTSTRLFPNDTTYSAPVLAVIDGQMQLIIGSGDGSVYGLQPRTGKILWNYAATMRGVNTTPLVVGKNVYCGHGEENFDDTTKMGAFFAIDASKTGSLNKTGELWRIKEEGIGRSAPLAVEDKLYAVDESGTFFIHDRETGKPLGKTKLGTMGRGSPVYGDGKIYAADATGRWWIFQPDGKKVKPIHQLRLSVDINGSPIISHGKVFLPTETMMYAIGLPDTKPSADPIPEREKETAVDQDKQPATALVTPVESLLKPGQSQELKVWLYNSRGQFLNVAKTGDVKFTVVGPGEVDKAGTFHASTKLEHGGTIVTAEIGGLKSVARMRTIPDFPWSFTFDDGVVPVTAIGLRYRHIGIDFDYYSQLKQRNPMASKLYIYLMTLFINNERPVAKFDDTTVQEEWTKLRRYLGLLEIVTNQKQGQDALDASLKLLQDDQVIKDWNWSGDEKIGAQLTVNRGSRKVTGNGALCKITTIPLGTKSQSSLGRADSKNYVIQADVYANRTPVSPGADPHSKLPDVGIIGQRYRLEMLGASQELKLYSWYPHDQKSFHAPFAWEPEIWYTMKLQVTNETRDGVESSICRGKVWKRDDKEPEAWTVEWADSPANFNGSPGLAGRSVDAEVFIDNVRVTSLATK